MMVKYFPLSGYRTQQVLSQDPSGLSFGQDRQFPENLLFGQVKISSKIFQLWLFLDDNQMFS